MLPSFAGRSQNVLHPLRQQHRQIQIAIYHVSLGMERRADGNASWVARVSTSNVFGSSVAEQLQLVQPDLRRIT